MPNESCFPVLQTDRLTLRMFCDSDLDDYAQMCGDADVMQFIGSGSVLGRDESWRNMALMIGHWQLRGYGLWAVEDRRSGRFVGRVGCWNPAGWPCFEIGWMLKREFWGQGFATEAAEAATAFAFEKLGRPQIISLIHPDNAGSIRVALRLGETLSDRIEVGGNEAFVYSLTREEWSSRRTPGTAGILGGEKDSAD